MAKETEDLVALILSALGAASASELCMLSESLTSESFLQLRRLWLLLGSPSRCIAIISFLDTLSHHHRRLLLARVTLRLVCRITDFLEGQTSSAASDSSLAHPEGTDTANHGFQAQNFNCLEARLNSKDVAVRVATAFPALVDESTHQQNDEEGVKGLNAKLEHPNMIHSECSSSSATCLQAIPDSKTQRLIAACAAELSPSSEKAKKDLSTNSAGADSCENPGVKIAIGKIALMDLEDPFLVNFSTPDPEDTPADYSLACANVANLDLARVAPVDHTLACASLVNLDMRNECMQSYNMRSANLEIISASMCSWGSLPNVFCSGSDLIMDMPSEEDMDKLSLPWNETDAAFLFLFLWESQSQECQEAMQRWCIDPFVYHLLIVQDMSVLVDDEKKASHIKAPRWRERLQQYLQQNVLQVGYGFPGIMALTNLPVSLSACIDTIGRFQRILESMNLDEGSEQKLPAASAATLHSLPTTVIGLSSEEKGKVCIICKEELKPSSVASQLPCMHVYHWDCILSWLKQRNNCPICRHELPSDDYDHELQRKIQILRERAV